MKKSIFLSLFILFLISFFITCKKEASDPSTPSAGADPQGSAEGARMAAGRSGYVYVESNEADTNRILIYEQHFDGTLSLDGMVASGGMGTGSGLGSQGALALNTDHSMLFAVNAGDNSISSFRVLHNGSLILMSTVSSGGTLPISITVHENFVYVLNATSADINGFKVDQAGNLTAIPGSQQSLSGAGTSPEQISFNKQGNYVYVSEKAVSVIASYAISQVGVASAGSFMVATGNNPYGFDFSRNRFMIVSNAEGGVAGASTITSYNGVNTGVLHAVKGAVPDNEGSACWLATDRDGFYAYVSNASTNAISSFWIYPNDGRLALLKASAATPNKPLDIMVSGNNLFVYNISSSDHSIGEYSRGANGALDSLGTVTGLPPAAAGLTGY